MNLNMAILLGAGGRYAKLLFFLNNNFKINLGNFLPIPDYQNVRELSFLLQPACYIIGGRVIGVYF